MQGLLADLQLRFEAVNYRGQVHRCLAHLFFSFTVRFLRYLSA